MKKPVARIVTLFLGLIATMHLLRLVFQVQVMVAGSMVPLWISFFGFLVATGLAILLWRETGRKE